MIRSKFKDRDSTEVKGGSPPTGETAIFNADLLRSVPTAAYYALAPDGAIAAYNDLARTILGRAPNQGEPDADFFRKAMFSGVQSTGASFRSPALRVLDEHLPQVSGSAFVSREDGSELFVAYHAVSVPNTSGVLVTLQPFSDAQQHLREGQTALEALQQIYRLAETISSATDLSEIFACAVSVTLNATGAGAVLFHTFDENGHPRLAAAGGLPERQITALDRFFPWPAGREPAPLIVLRIEETDVLAPIRTIAREGSFTALCAVPLTARGCRLGHCTALFTNPDAATGIPFQTLVTIGGMVTIALDRKKAELELVQREQESMQKMESRIIDRTRELSQVNRILMTEITERKRTEEQLKEEISERRKAEESLRVLSQHLVNAQESERRRLAQELHDGVNQILSATKLRILSAFERLEQPDRSAEQRERLRTDIDKARALLEESIKEIRNISKNLRPSVLDHLGLVPALRILCDEMRENGYAVTFRSDQLPDHFSDNIDVTLYRIIQECLNNIVKHSQAAAITITLAYRNNVIEAVIKDNGKGFVVDPDEPGDGRTGYGLASMRERGLYVGGTVSVTSKPGKGTRIVVRIPFSQSNHEVSHEEGTQA